MDNIILLRLLFITFIIALIFFLGVYMGSKLYSEALPCVSVQDTYKLWGFE